MIIKVNKRNLEKATIFADKRVGGSSDLYRLRGEKNPSKIWNDIVIGALGEFAIKSYMSKSGFDCSKPDLEIYESRKKSYDCDLKCGDIRIHVKSQSQASVKRYGSSWLMQRSDKLTCAPSDMDFLAFTNVKDDLSEVEILGFARADDICDNKLWGECRVPSYRNSKVALYFNDIEHIVEPQLDAWEFKWK